MPNHIHLFFRTPESNLSLCLSSVENPPENPLVAAVDGWLLGGREFVERIKRLAKDPTHHDELPLARWLSRIPLADVLEATSSHFGVLRTGNRI